MTTKWSEVRRRLDPDGRRGVNAAKGVIEAFEELHQVRHNALDPGDDRNDRAARWLTLVRVREAIVGEYEATAWEALTRSIVEAIIAGQPVWEAYARRKHGEVRPRIEVVIPPPTGEPPADPKRLVSALAAAIEEATERRRRGDIP